MKICKLMLALCLMLSIGCDKPKETPKTDEPTKTEEPTKEEPKEKTAASAPGTAPVMLSATGTKFDPPIKPAQLSDGAIYCDMGTVHWAATKTPADNKCPECGMMLKTYSAKKIDAQNKKAVDPHKGHDHGDGHDHKHDDGHKH